MPSRVLSEAVSRLAARDPLRTEADIQADIYVLLTCGDLALHRDQVARLEVQTGDGTRRRLDVEIGHAAIEVKRDLRVRGVIADAETQLAGYVATQARKLGTRYVGILTDGTDWYLYHLVGSDFSRVAELSLDSANPDAERVVVWLEAILATQQAVPPTPDEIRRRLGAGSPAHKLDHATLSALFASAADVPEVRLKHELWAKLLRTAFGKSFTDDSALFVNHTLLVLTAELIAHAVVGFDISSTNEFSPAALVQGTMFTSSKVHGVVEADFFDWVLHLDGGSEFVTSLAHRIARFDWRHVEHDVLKILYESIISQDERRSLGEYYTPDWLADRMVAATVERPLEQRVLDPSCGSGTFLFHAIRAYLNAADAAGLSHGASVNGVVDHVVGMDVHPVSVTLARVTYLLAIGPERLQARDRGPISIPVYLGDSLQWEQRRDLFGGLDEIRISTEGDDLVDGGGLLFHDDLVFPRSILHDAGDFDRLVDALAERAKIVSTKSSKDLVLPVLRQFGVHENDVLTLTATFDTMRRLHSIGRDHIWGYYVRNLIRPLWLAESAHQVDVLIGNPPWLRYSSMTDTMQARYKALAKDRGLLSGPLGASSRDLSTLFVTRAVELYLRGDGQFSFVMPHGTLTRKPADGFRSGRWGDEITVAFGESWDLEKAPTGFPMVSCVVHGRQTTNDPHRLPAETAQWSARLPSPNVSWEEAAPAFTIKPGRVEALDPSALPSPSPYKARFRDGAILYPRMLLFVEDAPSGPLGSGAGRVAVKSRRTSSEKMPWKEAPSLSGVLERAFVRQVHLGETMLPFRMLEPLSAVLPITDRAILTTGEVEGHPDLAKWWDAVEELWEQHKAPNDISPFLTRLNYHNQLAAQLPGTRNRVVYSKAGNAIAAARLTDPSAVIDHKLYWAPVSSSDEAHYLTAVLNSGLVLERVRPLQARGLFGGRDFDKNVFAIQIPTFDGSDARHASLARLGADAETLAAQVDLSGSSNFTRSRALVRGALAEAGITQQIEDVLAEVIPPILLD